MKVLSLKKIWQSTILKNLLKYKQRSAYKSLLPTTTPTLWFCCLSWRVFGGQTASTCCSFLDRLTGCSPDRRVCRGATGHWLTCLIPPRLSSPCHLLVCSCTNPFGGIILCCSKDLVQAFLTLASGRSGCFSKTGSTKPGVNTTLVEKIITGLNCAFWVLLRTVIVTSNKILHKNGQDQHCWANGFSINVPLSSMIIIGNL